MFHRIRQLAVAAALFAALGVGEAAHAGPANGSPGAASVSPQDLLYDYEMWIAWDVVKYYVVAKFADGHTEQFTFSSEQGAQDFIAWLAFHIHNFAGATIEEHVEMSPWTYFATYDTRLEAKNMAAYAISLDYYAVVVPVRAFQPSRYR